MNTLHTFAAPTGRFFLAIMFFMSGLTKISQYSGTQGYMEGMGVPGFLLPAVILTEAAGGLAIILGWKTKYVLYSHEIYLLPKRNHHQTTAPIYVQSYFNQNRRPYDQQQGYDKIVIACGKK